jgi:hypothetical protein
MKITDLVERSADGLEPVISAIRKVWREFSLQHRWPARDKPIPRNVAHSVIRGQIRVENEKGPSKGFSLEENIAHIANQWNWARSCAPLQMLQSDRYWRGLADQKRIAAQESEAGLETNLTDALSWLRNMRKTKDPKTPFPNWVRDIKAAAKALGKTTDLTPSQLAIWEKEVENTAQT